MEAESTTIASLAPISGGDNHFHGNTFVGPGMHTGSGDATEAHHGRTWHISHGLSCYDEAGFATTGSSNRYVDGAQRLQSERPIEQSLNQTGARERVALAELGSTRVSGLPFSGIAGSDDGVILREWW